MPPRRHNLFAPPVFHRFSQAFGRLLEASIPQRQSQLLPVLSGSGLPRFLQCVQLQHGVTQTCPEYGPVPALESKPWVSALSCIRDGSTPYMGSCYANQGDPKTCLGDQDGQSPGQQRVFHGLRIQAAQKGAQLVAVAGLPG